MSKFGNRSICINIKHKWVKWIIKNIKFAMLCVCKMEKIHEGLTSSKDFLFLALEKLKRKPTKMDFLLKKNTKFKRVGNILENN